MKSGFVAILGRPNVGKSTLLNAFLDYDLAIISSTPQTTRDQIKGIYNDKDSQIIFVDTPGIHKPKSKLGVSLNSASYKSLKDVDLVLFLTPVDELIGPGDKLILKRIENIKNRIAIITKTDLTKKNSQLDKRQKLLKSKYGFKLVLGISSLNTYGPQAILKDIKTFLPEGPKYYENDYMITDMSSKFVVKEIIREAAINAVYDEVAHSIGVLVENYHESQDILKIDAVVYVERSSQKPILIGKNASKIKSIGIKSRQKIANLFGKKTTLNLHVKVDKKWTKSIDKIKKFGY